MITFNKLIEKCNQSNNNYLKEEDIFDFILKGIVSGGMNIGKFLFKKAKDRVTGEAALRKLEKQTEKLRKIKDKEELKKELEQFKKDTGVDVEKDEEIQKEIKTEVEEEPDKEKKPEEDKLKTKTVDIKSKLISDEKKELLNKLKSKHAEYKKAETPEEKERLKIELKDLVTKSEKVQSGKEDKVAKKETKDSIDKLGLSKEELKTPIEIDNDKEIQLGSGLKSKDKKVRSIALSKAKKLKKSNESVKFADLFGNDEYIILND